jgi:hypothetical protein
MTDTIPTKIRDGLPPWLVHSLTTRRQVISKGVNRRAILAGAADEGLLALGTQLDRIQKEYEA